MRPPRIVVPVLFLSCAVLAAQPDSSTAPVKIYAAGSDVTAPQLVPSSAPRSYATGHCRANEDGAVKFSLIVDASGQPRNIYFLNPNGDDLDLIALREAITDRFTPGTHAGQPVPVAASLEIKLHACLAERKDARGKTQDVFELSSAPVQELEAPVDPPQQAVLVSGSGLSTNPSDPDAGVEKPGGDVKPPVYFSPPDSTYNLERLALGRGDYKVSVVVDRYGLPQRLKILEVATPGHEQALASVVRLQRWKPAMKDGGPIPCRTELRIENR